MPRQQKQEADHQKEVNKLKATIRSLEHELDRLKRKVARERKHRGRDVEDEIDEQPASPTILPTCPKCRSLLLDIPTSHKTIRICSNKACLWRVTL